MRRQTRQKGIPSSGAMTTRKATSRTRSQSENRRGATLLTARAVMTARMKKAGRITARWSAKIEMVSTPSLSRLVRDHYC